MLQEIEPYKFHNEFYKRDLKETDYYVYVKDGKIAVKDNEGIISLLRVKDIGIRKSRFLFCIDDMGIYELKEDIEWNDFYIRKDKRTFKEIWMEFAALEALRLINWYKKNQYCGYCSNKMKESDAERAMICPECGNIVYPRINPVAIVGIVNDNKLLLTRYANHSRASHYALVAGFVEFGETVEDAIRREVKEEVNLNIKDIRYVVSQSWPLSESLIFGFYARLDGDDKVSFTDNGLDTAVWQTPEEIEHIEAWSLTSYLINNFKEKNGNVFE